MVNNCCQGGALVAAILTGDGKLLGQALDSDQIIEPVRAPLIPGMLEVKEAAKAAGESGTACFRVLLRKGLRVQNTGWAMAVALYHQIQC
jgi:hypothetical protein